MFARSVHAAASYSSVPHAGIYMDVSVQQRSYTLAPYKWAYYYTDHIRLQYEVYAVLAYCYTDQISIYDYSIKYMSNSVCLSPTALSICSAVKPQQTYKDSIQSAQ